jgi:hypothetical protein
MSARRSALALALGSALIAAAPGHLAPHAHAQEELPPVSYICPMPSDADVLEDKPGICPICKMELIPARIDLAYSCITHPAIMRSAPGTCPLDRRDLVRVNVEVHWTCAATPNDRLIEPGTCPDGTPRKKEMKVRAHGDHNPRHGGQFFMAEDKWHHLEGTHPRGGLFRMYFYDNFTQPIDGKGFTGRAIVRDANNKEVASFNLKASRDGKTLDAQIKNDALPLRITARVRFKKETNEQQFDFVFPEYSKDIPAPAKPNTAATTAAKQPPPAAAPAPAASPTPAPEMSPSPAAQTPPADVQTPAPAPAGSSVEFMPPSIVQEEVLPSTLPELLALLDERGREAEQLIKDGVFAQVYVPAMSGKNIALALENFVTSLPNRQRAQAADALRRAVVAAWKLDMAGDIGNRDDLMAAYSLFAAAVSDIKAVYGAR